VISLIKCNLFNGNIEYFSEIFFHMISQLKYAKRSLLLFDNNLTIVPSLVLFQRFLRLRNLWDPALS
jgi:hypothetical protein